jgi:spermidine synthase
MKITHLLLVLALASGVMRAVPAAAELKVIHSERSLYRNLFITEDGDLRCLTFRKANAGARQTCIKKTDPEYLVFPYTRMMMGALYLNPRPARILIIGLGGGTLPMTLRSLLPESAIDAVEIDPAVVKAARGYFGFKDDANLKCLRKMAAFSSKRPSRPARFTT